MVELPFFRHFQFAMDLERIEAAFDASIAAMEQTYRAAEEASERYEESGEDDDEYDEDGALIRSTRGDLRWQVLQASQAQTVIRQAFVTSIFHLWEISARTWTASDEHDFRQLRRAVRKLDYPVDGTGLTLLNDVNNLLKHDNAATGERVFKRAPQLFWQGKRPTGAHWRSSLKLSNADVKHFLEVVRRSGPTYP
ncbi:hypothetical protein [Sphingomonas abietis]|uniref:Uncharacterized protein n=1 Tax=Sphingomonas abietis TaxID=3012344 RepID=A0ABY7NK64_9SPHN|nr:hypothetical protein [Sphingomonas abietis]WBO20992.1 hypothetical protein PBT88_12330 [Sphingomonas abietis]